MSEVLNALSSIINYGLEKELIDELDSILARNELIHMLDIDYSDSYKSDKNYPILEAIEILYKEDDLNLPLEKFVSRIMGALTPRNSEIVRKYKAILENQGPEKAIDWFYEYSKDILYIRADQVAKNKKWIHESEYGDIEITINLSKPEKDPRDIASAKDKESVDYPKCPICLENIGYKGRPGFSERSNHRVLPIRLKDENWYIQFSPYVYYRQHLIVLSEKHEDMEINRATIERLSDFVDQYPELFIGSNADLPIVGGSILNHNHFQGGNYSFPIEKAKVYSTISSDKYELDILDWPVTTLRLRTKDRNILLDLADKIIETWKDYNNQDLNIQSHSGDINHNTSTLVMRKDRDEYNLYISLRNNRTDEDNPYGIFHAEEKYHHIKKENIGLIEVMGMAILPARLNENLNEEKQREMGKVFVEILKNCGVFKRDAYSILEKEVREWLS